MSSATRKRATDSSARSAAKRRTDATAASTTASPKRTTSSSYPRAKSSASAPSSKPPKQLHGNLPTLYNMELTVARFPGSVRARVPADMRVSEVLDEFLAEGLQFDDVYHLYTLRAPNGLVVRSPLDGPNRKGSPRGDELSWAELGLQAGDVMAFHFDFGDDWHMTFTCLGASNDAAADSIIDWKRRGKLPVQYSADPIEDESE